MVISLRLIGPRSFGGCRPYVFPDPAVDFPDMVLYPPVDRIQQFVRLFPGHRSRPETIVYIEDILYDPGMFVAMFLETGIPGADHEKLLRSEMIDGESRQILDRVPDRFLIHAFDGCRERVRLFDESPVLVINDANADGDTVVPFESQNTIFFGQSEPSGSTSAVRSFPSFRRKASTAP